jgi:hypothetical protein
MMRTKTTLREIACTAAVAALFAGNAAAQTPPPMTAPLEASVAAPVSCPRGPLSIYFASGDVAASPQAETLIGRIGDAVNTCEPDGIDLIARIDSKVDGDHAVALALARLQQIADDLIAHGLSADRIRIAAQAANSESAPGLNRIDVLFREEHLEMGEPVEAPPPPRTVPSQAI